MIDLTIGYVQNHYKYESLVVYMQRKTQSKIFSSFSYKFSFVLFLSNIWTLNYFKNGDIVVAIEP